MQVAIHDLQQANLGGRNASIKARHRLCHSRGSFSRACWGIHTAGICPGTNFGKATDISADGSTVVGLNSLPPELTAHFVGIALMESSHCLN